MSENNENLEKTVEAAEETAAAELTEQAEETAAAELTEEELAAKAEEEALAAKAVRKKKVLKELKEWGIALLTAFAVVMVLKTCLFMPIRVDGASMSPTLKDGEMLGVTVFDVRFLNKLERNDVVICHYPDRGLTYFVKRLVGLPGDTVKRVNGVTYINDVALDPARDYGKALSTDYDGYVLGEDEYFVVGDNRYNSHDSRTWKGTENAYNGLVGPISKKMIVGHARFVMFPFNKVRSIPSEQFDPQ